MCGIAGIFHKDKNQPLDRQILLNMAAIQHHRGPDGFGVEVMDGKGVGFSHARLSIIDLKEARGRQPFRSDDGRFLLSHNGEFYGYQPIRADLTSRGHRFKSKSDSEIVLHLMARYGLDAMLAQLRGEFAFALYDDETEELHLVRDRFGIKPLYYYAGPNGVVFGSEIKVIFAHPDVPRAFNNVGLYHQLIQVMVPGSTAFEGIEQVRPGHVVTIKREGSGDVPRIRHFRCICKSNQIIEGEGRVDKLKLGQAGLSIGEVRRNIFTKATYDSQTVVRIPKRDQKVLIAIYASGRNGCGGNVGEDHLVDGRRT